MAKASFKAYSGHSVLYLCTCKCIFVYLLFILAIRRIGAPMMEPTMNAQTRQNQNQTQSSPLTASRKPGMLEHGQLVVVVLSIFIGGGYIARALLAG